jgi:hypothetical protein
MRAEVSKDQAAGLKLNDEVVIITRGRVKEICAPDRYGPCKVGGGSGGEPAKASIHIEEESVTVKQSKGGNSLMMKKGYKTL